MIDYGGKMPELQEHLCAFLEHCQKVLLHINSLGYLGIECIYLYDLSFCCLFPNLLYLNFLIHCTIFNKLLLYLSQYISFCTLTCLNYTFIRNYILKVHGDA